MPGWEVPGWGEAVMAWGVAEGCSQACQSVWSDTQRATGRRPANQASAARPASCMPSMTVQTYFQTASWSFVTPLHVRLACGRWWATSRRWGRAAPWAGRRSCHSKQKCGASRALACRVGGVGKQLVLLAAGNRSSGEADTLLHVAGEASV